MLWEKVKNVYKIILFDVVCLALVFWGSRLILDRFDLMFRKWVNVSVFLFIFVGGIAGVIQLVLKIRWRWLKITSIILLCITFLCSLPLLHMITAFGVLGNSEYAVSLNGQMYVARDTSFLDKCVDYYEYKNLFVCGSQIKASETGNGCTFYGVQTDLSTVRIDGLYIGSRIADIETEKYTPSDRFPEKEGTYNFEELRIETANGAVIKITADFAETTIKINGQACPSSSAKIRSFLGQYSGISWYDGEQNLRQIEYWDGKNKISCYFVYDNSNQQIVWVILEKTGISWDN